MLSGGEPTLHPTSGLLIGWPLERDRADPAEHQRVQDRPRRRAAGPAAPPPGTGRGLPAVRWAAAPILQAPPRGDLDGSSSGRSAAVGAEIFTTLTMTAAMGVNDDEIGDVIQGPWTPPTSAASVHPAGVRLGPLAALDPMDRLTHTGVLAAWAADRRAGHLARPDRATLLASALLQRRVPHPHGFRRMAFAGGLVGAERLKENLGWSPTGSPIGRSPRSCARRSGSAAGLSVSSRR